MRTDMNQLERHWDIASMISDSLLFIYSRSIPNRRSLLVVINLLKINIFENTRRRQGKQTDLAQSSPRGSVTELMRGERGRSVCRAEVVC